MKISKFLSLLTVITVITWVGCKRTCDTACLNNGTCDNGVCVCTEGHWGAACQNDSCITCLNHYVDIYFEAYFDNLDTLTNGFCEDCVTFAMVDTAHARAARKSSQLTCLDLSQPVGRINLSQIIKYKQYQSVSDSFTAEQKDDMIKLNSWMDFNPLASPGYIPLPRCK